MERYSVKIDGKSRPVLIKWLKEEFSCKDYDLDEDYFEFPSRYKVGRELFRKGYHLSPAPVDILLSLEEFIQKVINRDKQTKVSKPVENYKIFN